MKNSFIDNHHVTPSALPTASTNHWGMARKKMGVGGMWGEDHNKVVEGGGPDQISSIDPGPTSSGPSFSLPPSSSGPPSQKSHCLSPDLLLLLLLLLLLGLGL
eukprot:CAMPEP_0183303446 /NCGR_PEP_ID=MMETSP0160_2-20130417/8886_1 /TAXON_ID=2839 ORGANISM="Odontella Sinensis, Strain Grunow 1884" /NCGR_SAMPLE_ID=MMETSP0160_2 /ASSEMBLY_ACC=CAM_ASM_000250 /LENGTH=102 /DNA_ID=CAMNT_0025466353 /DNA_START=446 /DNA_END=752 /DNA_ORIENTATION=+